MTSEKFLTARTVISLPLIRNLTRVGSSASAIISNNMDYGFLPECLLIIHVINIHVKMSQYSGFNILHIVCANVRQKKKKKKEEKEER